MNKQNKTDIEALLKKHNKGLDYPVYFDNFVMNAKRYIKAIKQGRMICSIDKVSTSGMSRTLKFVEIDGRDRSYYMYNFYQLFDVLGYNAVGNTDYFRIYGCGMDMVFHTNYSIIRQLYNFGLMQKKTCIKLEQMTPNVI